MKGKFLGLLAISLLIVSGLPAYASDTIKWSFVFDSLKQSGNNYSYSGASQLNINSEFSLPLITVYLRTEYPLAKNDFIVADHDKLDIGTIPIDLSQFDNKITGANNRYKNSPLHDPARLTDFVYDIQKIILGNITFQVVTFLPLTVAPDGHLIFICEISLASNIATSNLDIKAAPNNLIGQINQPQDKSALHKISAIDGIPLGSQYVIITSSALAATFQKLADFRAACGIPSAVALIDSIYAYYSGRDNAEKLRNYLLEYYENGGQYLLLGGDDAILPIRYLCYYNTTVAPDKREIFLSDLYFADMTGEWDKDGDGTWGEPTDDAPDIMPELSVGRIPVKTAASADRYISKLIAYCTNPGRGDYGYLTRSLFFSSDEMRDYPAIGQHGVIAQSYPPNFEIDTANMIETPSGGAAAPTNPNGVASISKLSEGYGIVNIIAHGRADGFLVKSANYADWPASYILTGTSVSGHGSVMDIVKNNKSSLYYSLSCDVGGYDLDTINGESVDLSLVERLLTIDSGGAVAMVANTRWGWVYSSYLLQQSFMKNLFGAAEGNSVRAVQLSWLEYPFLRDLIYGQTYFGDPALTIYRTRPQNLTIDINRAGPDKYQISAANNGTAVPDTRVNISLDGAIIYSALTDQNGICNIDFALDYDAEYSIAAVKDNHTTAYKKYIPTIAANVEDGDNITLPKEFALAQNYPNPFNPATTISYSLPVRADITLTIYNILGQTMKVYSAKEQSAGNYNICWDGTNDAGQNLSSGLYLYRLTAGAFSETKKMILLR